MKKKNLKMEKILMIKMKNKNKKFYNKKKVKK